jgi:predicted transposase/invertase (TIGR01784 family)
MPVKKNVKKAVKKKHLATATRAVAKKTVKKAAERALVSFDFAVKYLLRGKSDYVILSGFLSELMGKKVVVKGIMESESNKATKDDKTNRVDLIAQIGSGELAVFEIQFLEEWDFFGKVLYGVSNAIKEQVNVGDKYNIKKVYSISIAYFNLNAKKEYLFSGKFNDFHGVHYKDEVVRFAQSRTPTSKRLFDIHPEYYLILPRMFDEKLRGRFDEWVYILKNSKARDDFRAAGIKEAKTKLDYLRMTPKRKKEYEAFMEHRRSASSVLETAVGKGELRGLRKGRQEGQDMERTKHVKSMYKTGFTVKQIVKGLNLSETVVRQILGL